MIDLMRGYPPSLLLGHTQRTAASSTGCLERKADSTHDHTLPSVLSDRPPCLATPLPQPWLGAASCLWLSHLICAPCLFLASCKPLPTRLRNVLGSPFPPTPTCTCTTHCCSSRPLRSNVHGAASPAPKRRTLGTVWTCFWLS